MTWKDDQHVDLWDNSLGIMILHITSILSSHVMKIAYLMVIHGAVHSIDMAHSYLDCYSSWLTIYVGDISNN